MRLICAIAISAILGKPPLGQNATVVYHHLDRQVLKIKSGGESDSSSARLTIPSYFYLQGYAGVSLIDSVRKKNTLHCYYNALRHYRYVSHLWENAKKPTLVTEKKLSDFAKASQKKLTALSNRGYPFAGINITRQTETGDTIHLSWRIDTSSYFVIDMINIRSNDKIHQKTLMNMIVLKPGDEYSELRLREISRMLANSEFFELKQPPQVIFRKSGKAELFLFVARKKSSNADGYVGFNQDPDSRKLVFNGNINLSLKNTLNRAEVLELNWKSNPDKTQNLFARLEYPWLFGLPLGLSTRLNLRKQDTTFIRSDVWLEAIYLNPYFSVSIYDQMEGSAIISSSAPSGLRDYRKNTLGLRASLKPPLPERLSFYRPETGFSAGVYQYRNDTISDNKQRVANNKYAVWYSHKLQINKVLALRNRLDFQGLNSSISMSANELVYYGGLRSVRGFYELELFGNNVWIISNDLEWQPVNVISFSVLYDYSIADLPIGKNFTNSFGIGFGLVSRNSRLELVVANGILNHNPVSFSNARVHIGFRSNF